MHPDLQDLTQDLTQDGSILKANDITQAIASLTATFGERLVALRREIHAHPELAFEEHETAARIADILREAGIESRGGIGRTGVLADIEGGLAGPCVLVRADMDALPIHENTGLPYSSKYPGKMHACGHDIHSAIVVGVGLVLKALAPRLPGTVRLMFQPAEETLEGARAMIEDGALTGVDYAIGFHNRPEMPVGLFGVVRGATTASTDRFHVDVHGKGGHTGRMHQVRSPILAAAELIGSLSALVAQELNPMQPCVIGIGSVQGGSAPNVVPDVCTFSGTVRTRSADMREQAEQAIRRHCAAFAMLRQVECNVRYEHGVPAQVNNDALFAVAPDFIRSQLGDVVQEIPPSMGGEDFAYISEAVPSFRFSVGAATPGRNDILHTATVQPDEQCIGLAVQAVSRIVMDIMQRETRAS